jgi:hypothetical protein
MLYIPNKQSTKYQAYELLSEHFHTDIANIIYEYYYIPGKVWEIWRKKNNNVEFIKHFRKYKHAIHYIYVQPRNTDIEYIIMRKNYDEYRTRKFRITIHNTGKIWINGFDTTKTPFNQFLVSSRIFLKFVCGEDTNYYTPYPFPSNPFLSRNSTRYTTQWMIDDFRDLRELTESDEKHLLQEYIKNNNSKFIKKS